MLHNIPDWSARHGFTGHSNPRSKDRAKDLFEKSVARPQINKAFDTLNDKQSTDKDKLLARHVLHKFYDNRSSSNMEGGKAVQTSTDLRLVPDEVGATLDLAEATQAGLEQFQFYQPKDEADADRKAKYLDEFPAVVEHAVLGLQEAMAGDNRILGEIQLKDTLPGLAVPYDTRPDYVRRGDLKTKWSTPSSKSKTGWTSARLPSSLTGMFDMNNVFQCAGFHALNGKRPPFLVYASASDYRIFTPENAPELRDDYLQDVIQETISHCKVTENILRTASNTDELLSLVSPDWRAMCWKESPTYLEEARKIWRL
tara:strand:- start:761 stop:1699 length:939 start_codon:yes stop_codon:yes gene_type:complete